MHNLFFSVPDLRCHSRKVQRAHPSTPANWHGSMELSPPKRSKPSLLLSPLDSSPPQVLCPRPGSSSCSDFIATFLAGYLKSYSLSFIFSIRDVLDRWGQPCAQRKSARPQDAPRWIEPARAKKGTNVSFEVSPSTVGPWLCHRPLNP